MYSAQLVYITSFRILEQHYEIEALISEFESALRFGTYRQVNTETE